MIQDIAPQKFHNEYMPLVPKDNGRCLIFKGSQVLIKSGAWEIVLPEYRMLAGLQNEITYLFRIDDQEYYLVMPEKDFSLDGYSFENLQTVRRFQPRDMLLAVMTAYHLYVWYRDNRFCGRCGTKVVHSPSSRMLKCPACSNEIYPKIAPAVIVGVTDGDKILLTRYKGRDYKGYALIAGFTEIGETAEETVAREVFEEAGVHVKNITYFNSQPWGLASDLLLGFFAELDGADEIKMDGEELSMAGWYTKADIDYQPDDVSLTNAMIRAFLNRN